MENEEYYTLPNGKIVFTEKFHLRRGKCCGSGCLHCPYNYENVKEPKKTELLKKREDDRISDKE